MENIILQGRKLYYHGDYIDFDKVIKMSIWKLKTDRYNVYFLFSGLEEYEMTIDEYDIAYFQKAFFNN